MARLRELDRYGGRAVKNFRRAHSSSCLAVSLTLMYRIVTDVKQSWLSVSLNCLWKRYNHIPSTPETAAVHVRILWFALYVEILPGNLCIPTFHITPGGGGGDSRLRSMHIHSKEKTPLNPPQKISKSQKIDKSEHRFSRPSGKI